jgi:hypothetical protein
MEELKNKIDQQREVDIQAAELRDKARDEEVAAHGSHSSGPLHAIRALFSMTA